MKKLKLLQSDPYLMPFKDAIEGRYRYAADTEQRLTTGGKLSDFATGYLYFGLHRTTNGWVFREWAPNATAMYLTGDFNGWQKQEAYRVQPIGNGNFECYLPSEALHHGQLYKLLVEWQGGSGERIPSYATRVVQDEQTKIFSA